MDAAKLVAAIAPVAAQHMISLLGGKSRFHTTDFRRLLCRQQLEQVGGYAHIRDFNIRWIKDWFWGKN